MAGFSLRVTPEILEQKAGEFTGIIDKLQRQFDNIHDISTRTRGYWIGEAGDKDREGYASYEDDIHEMISRLREHPMDLLKMAGIYRQSEQKAKEVSAALETDQIV